MRRPVSARVRRRRAGAAMLLLALIGGTTAMVRHGGPDDAPPAPAPAGTPAASRPSSSALPGVTPAPVATLAAAASLGPRAASTVPSTTSQVVVVRGDGAGSAGATIVLLRRAPAGWVRVAQWRGHNGARGWTADHREGDLRTPAGTYSLTDAGGLKPDPGTALPYHRSPSFVPTGDSVFGDSLAGSFDYVVAVDYNRRAGRSPLDPARPLGRDKGGGIWLHVDHGGPTHGCVSVPEPGMRQLLVALDPRARPVVVMGDPAFLAA